MEVTYVVEFADGATRFAVASVEAARAEIEKRRAAGDQFAFPARIIEYGPGPTGVGRLVETATQ